MIQSIRLPAQSKWDERQFWIYRGDLESKVAPGNKQHKLKYELIAAAQNQAHTIGTFGGPHSNHVAAFVARCTELQRQPLIVVRGETHTNLTPTLRLAVDKGAILFPSSREDYRLGMDSTVKQQIDQHYMNVHWIPEGGSSSLGTKGCLDWAMQIHQACEAHQINAVHVCVASGTGTTAAGFWASPFEEISVFSALKGVHDLKLDLSKLLQGADLKPIGICNAYDDIFHGGFGKVSSALLSFLRAFKTLNPNVPLDPIYTSKMLFHVNQLVEQGRWTSSNTLFIHTGGLQGWQGMKPDQQIYENYRLFP